MNVNSVSIYSNSQIKKDVSVEEKIAEIIDLCLAGKEKQQIAIKINLLKNRDCQDMKIRKMINSLSDLQRDMTIINERYDVFNRDVKKPQWFNLNLIKIARKTKGYVNYVMKTLKYPEGVDLDEAIRKYLTPMGGSYTNIHALAKVFVLADPKYKKIKSSFVNLSICVDEEASSVKCLLLVLVNKNYYRQIKLKLSELNK